MTRADRNIAWIEARCRVPEGMHAGKPLKLRPWQRDVIRTIYDNPHGTRMAIISFARKNGKTALAACLLLLHLCGPEALPNTQLVSAAQSRDQAALLFKLASRMIRLNPDLNAAITIRDHAKQLEFEGRGTEYRALSSDAGTAYGLSPVFAVHDELGQVKGPSSELYEAVETAMGAHDTPLSIVISTQAPTDADLLSVLIDDAASGVDPSTTLSLYTAPRWAFAHGLKTKVDPFDVETIRAANPALGDFRNEKDALDNAEKARRMPAREPSYRNLILNQRVQMRSPFVSETVWNDNGAAPVPSRWNGMRIWAGLDLSSTTDLSALVIIAENMGAWQVYPTFWLPEDGLEDKALTDKVPYTVWAEQGYLKTTPGKTIDYEWVAVQVADLFENAEVEGIAFDRWNWKHFKPWLIKAGLEDWQLDKFKEFGQGFQSMSPALRTFESDLLNSRFRHGNHPVLTMCAANAVVTTDPSENRKLDKGKSNGRIDGMVALTMARGIAGEMVSDEGYFVEGGVTVA
jgi:phage terminase large subunit-like protein